MTTLAADALQKHTIFLPEYLTGWQLFRTTKFSTGFRVSRQAVENTFVFSCFSKLPEIYCLLVEGHFFYLVSDVYTKIFLSWIA